MAAAIVAAAFALLVPSLGGQAKAPQNTFTECGPLADQTLRCPRFGFTYKVVFGWVDRTADMNAGPQSSANANSKSENSGTKDVEQSASSTGSETLLAVFERPPSAPGETINSAAVIAAEPLANYHGIKTAGEYFGAISELAEQRGFKAVNGPYSFSVGSKQLVRGDFSKERNKLTMYQTSLVMIEKGYIVSFTFIAGSEDEVNDLLGKLTFGTHGRGSHAGSKQ
ncbi:MAG TPA: hypothetical protein VJO35_02655 [Terriglobales bacterium]|nr:hypothetical protein [Terriglobales bacterium]